MSVPAQPRTHSREPGAAACGQLRAQPKLHRTARLSLCASRSAARAALTPIRAALPGHSRELGLFSSLFPPPPPLFFKFLSFASFYHCNSSPSLPPGRCCRAAASRTCRTWWWSSPCPARETCPTAPWSPGCRRFWPSPRWGWWGWWGWGARYTGPRGCRWSPRGAPGRTDRSEAARRRTSQRIALRVSGERRQWGDVEPGWLPAKKSFPKRRHFSLGRAPPSSAPAEPRCSSGWWFELEYGEAGSNPSSTPKKGKDARSRPRLWGATAEGGPGVRLERGFPPNLRVIEAGVQTVVLLRFLSEWRGEMG